MISDKKGKESSTATGTGGFTALLPAADDMNEYPRLRNVAGVFLRPENGDEPAPLPPEERVP